MLFILCPALGLVLSGAKFWSGTVAIFLQRSSANVDSLIESHSFVGNETCLSKVLVTVLLLLRPVVGDVGGVASLVVAVVALDNLVILSLLDHLNFINTSLAIISRSSSSNFIK